MLAERATVEQRGLRLVDRIERVAPKVWAVPSQSAADELHVIAVVGGAWQCDCASHQWRGQRGQPCAHIEAVRLWVQRATARQPRKEVALT